MAGGKGGGGEGGVKEGVPKRCEPRDEGQGSVRKTEKITDEKGEPKRWALAHSRTVGNKKQYTQMESRKGGGGNAVAGVTRRKSHTTRVTEWELERERFISYPKWGTSGGGGGGERGGPRPQTQGPTTKGEERFGGDPEGKTRGSEYHRGWGEEGRAENITHWAS